MRKELIGPRLIELRNSQGLTRAELAKETGLTIRAIEGYERGERVPRDEVKIKLADYFDKTVQSIFFDK